MLQSVMTHDMGGRQLGDGMWEKKQASPAGLENRLNLNPQQRGTQLTHPPRLLPKSPSLVGHHQPCVHLAFVFILPHQEPISV